MQDKRYIICGNASAKGISDDPKRDLRLRLSGKDGQGNITLRIEDIHSKMVRSVPTQFHDLLEIATYVYSADQAIKRGADDVDNFGDGWRRDLHFVVPVRNLEFWRSANVLERCGRPWASCPTTTTSSTSSRWIRITRSRNTSNSTTPSSCSGVPSRW
jgi:hypothetical protein